MHILRADLFSVAVLLQANAIAITTNAILRADRKAVMGAGVARAAAQRWPDLPTLLAQSLARVGNHVAVLKTIPGICLNNNTFLSQLTVVAFPTKEHWKDPSRLDLIARSAQELRDLADDQDWHRVVAPPFGCGHGQLEWAAVEPILSPILDDRFQICFLPRR